jgi:hypothetical protein
MIFMPRLNSRPPKSYQRVIVVLAVLIGVESAGWTCQN